MAERDSHPHRMSSPELGLVDVGAHENPLHHLYLRRSSRPPKSAQIDLSACDTISPIPIVNECSDSGGACSKLKKVTRKRHRRRSRRIRGDPFANPFERINYITENATTFALHHHHPSVAAHSHPHTNTNMHLANIVLKPQVSRLLNDNEQLNHRVNRMSERNRTLSLERERLLTTIQNTAAILQSTVTSLGRESHFQLEDVPKKAPVPPPPPPPPPPAKSPESIGSDFLERSTKCTIKEFDNLLTALQTNGRVGMGEKVESRATFDLGYGSGKSKSLSQYDIIVKWLNNETPQRSGSTNRDASQSTSTTSTSTSSSSSTSTVCQDELDKLLESATVTNEKCFTLIAKGQNDVTVVPAPAPTNTVQEVTQPRTILEIRSCDKTPTTTQGGENRSKDSRGEETLKSSSGQQENMVVEMDADREGSGTRLDEVIENVPEESMLWMGHQSSLVNVGETTVNDNVKDETAEEFVAPAPTAIAVATTAATVATVRTTCNSSSVEETKSNATSDSQTNQDEHEEFISLCNTMIQRMDSMISRTSNTAHIKEFMLEDGKKVSPAGTIPAADMNTMMMRQRKSQPQPQLQPPPQQHSYERRRRPHVDLRKLDRAISTTSDLSWPDLDQVENEGDLKTVQKCLASLEVMNIRRTNQALTQTLIIKALRKLLARQFCHLSRAHRDPDTSDSEPGYSAVEQNDVGNADARTVEGAGAADGAAGASCVNVAKIVEAAGPAEGKRPKSGEIYQIINNVSKSIIYNDMSHEFVKLHNNADGYERQQLPGSGNRKLIKCEMNFGGGVISGSAGCGRVGGVGGDGSNQANAASVPQQAANEGRRKCNLRRRKSNYYGFQESRPKIATELSRLQAEEQKPIPRCWFYVAILLVLSQLHLFRRLKNFVHIGLKF